MNILIVTRSFDQQIGGMESHTQEIARYLIKAGDNVDVITPMYRLEPTIKIDGVKVIRIAPPPSRLLKYSLMFWNKVGLYLRTNGDKYDAIINVSMGIGGARYESANIRTKTVTILHGTYRIERQTLLQAIFSKHFSIIKVLGVPYTYLFELIEKRVLSNSSLVVVVSPQIEASVNKRIGENDKVKLISNFAKTRERSRLDDTHIRILYLGRLHSEKGVTVALNALQELVKAEPQLNDKISLSIVGDGPELKIIEKQIKLAKASNLVQLWGKVKPDRVGDITGIHHILLFPSLGQEGMPLSLLEGMGAGLVPIASRMSATQSIITNNVNGMLIQPGSTDEMVAALKMLVFDSQKLNEMSASAHSTIKAHFNADTQLSKLHRLIQKTAAK